VAGPTLPDDATLQIIDWHGDHGRPRRTSAGADLGCTAARQNRPPRAPFTGAELLQALRRPST
jgi:hypothetical protein